MSGVSGKLVSSKAFQVAVLLFLGLPLVTGQAYGQIPDSRELYGATQLRGADPGELGVAFNFSTAQTSLVRILVHHDKASRTGTGFLVGGRRLVATSNHVIDNSKNIHLGFLDKNGRARWIQAELKVSDPAKDLAIVEAGEDIEGAPLALANYEPEWASDVYAMGFPVAADEGAADTPSFAIGGPSFLRPSVVKGIVSRVLDQPSITARMQHQAPISPGYSGGPLIDRCGAVVGVSNSHHRTDNGLSYAVLGSDLIRLARADGVAVSVSYACRPNASAGAERPAHPDFSKNRAQPALPPALPKPVESDAFETQMFRQAENCLERADIASARLFLENLAERGSARGMLGLGLTYDPNYLDQLTVFGLQPDIERARKWYLKALEHGAVEAQWRLDALPRGAGAGVLADEKSKPRQ